MTDSGEHRDDETLSASIDDRLAPDEAAATRAHLQTCVECRERLEDMQAVVGLLRQLPTLDPPRRVWGPRPVADPPNVVRLRRLYTVARAGAAALAAVFVLSSAGALYEATRGSHGSAAAVVSTSSQAAPAAAAIPPAAYAPAAPANAAPPRALSAPAPAATPVAGPSRSDADAAARSAAAAAEVAADQTKSAPSVGAVPTQAPTVSASTPLGTRPTAAVQPFPPPPADPGGPLRAAAIVAGSLAVLTFTAAFVLRRRLKLASIPDTE